MEAKTTRNVVVVGASRGIGLALATRLAARGGRVVATCRSAPAELGALAVEVEGVDTASADSISAFARYRELVSIFEGIEGVCFEDTSRLSFALG